MKTFSTTKFVKSHFKSENSKWTSANDSDNKECLAPIKQNVILPKRIPFFSLVDLYYKTLYSFIITSRKTVEIWLLSFYRGMSLLIAPRDWKVMERHRCCIIISWVRLMITHSEPWLPPVWAAGAGSN